MFESKKHMDKNAVNVKAEEQFQKEMYKQNLDSSYNIICEMLPHLEKITNIKHQRNEID